MPIESFSQHIAEVSNGALDDELTDFIHKSVREIKDNGGKYEISLKIKITGREEKGEFIVALIPTYTTKHTPIDIGGSAYQCTADNRLEAPVK